MPKLTGNQHRDLIEEYNIHFDGPIPPARWPDRYKDTFQHIRDIQRLRYDEYGSNERRGTLSITEMKKRVVKLNDKAYKCRMHRENEITWRLKTEPTVVSRFGTEVVCSTCQNRLWASDFQALPDDQSEARRLQRRRAKRAPCECDPAGKARQDSDEPGKSLLFWDRGQWPVLFDPIDKLELEERGLSPRQPDRVFGLGQTKVVKEQTAARQDLRHSPFQDRKVLYPFLIIEAKSEKGSLGFNSIETQTAFPIRTLLKLQQDLQRVSEISLSPLVWFFANQGDEWRVYASIIDGSRFRVIDLWHGTVLSEDGALQLLLIVDYICDWARDVYRLNILRCLSGGDMDMRDITPAYTTTSSQVDESDGGSTPSTPATPRAESPEMPSSTDLPKDIEEVDTEMQEIDLEQQDSDTFTSLNINDSNPLLRLLAKDRASNPWSRYATVRHSNLILFSFSHIAIPEDDAELRAFLSLGQDQDIGWDAITLARRISLLLEEDAVTITIDGVYHLETLWTRTNHQRGLVSDDPLRAAIVFHTFIRSNWQVERILYCMTGSRPAIEKLATIAGADRVTDWALHRCPCLITVAEPLRSLCGEAITTAALTTFSAGLAFDKHFEWATTLNLSTSAVMRLISSSTVSTYGYRETILEELLPGRSVPPSLADLLKVPRGLGRKGAIILKKPRGLDETCPNFCLMVFDDTSLDNEAALGRKIAEVFNVGEVYVIQSERNGQDVIIESDKTAIALWRDILLGKKPADAAWPSETVESCC